MSKPVSPTPAPGKSPRDPRLDFFRGIAMLIIMVAHIQWNAWANWIPAAFGPSDAAEMFVFCSGYAAAIAFGSTFVRAGFWMGLRRIALRCWQVYWAHLGLFFAIATISAVAHAWFSTPERNYIDGLNLAPFFDDTGQQLVGLFTLTYVPNYFDILPMYIVILMMVPIVMALQRVHLYAAIGFCVGLYAAAWILDLNFPAEPWSDRRWFFNPLCWQLLFFTSFMIARGWIKPPPFTPRLLAAAALFVLVMIPVSRWQIYMQVPVLEAVSDWLRMRWHEQEGIFKTNHHPLRYLHILALAYLGVWLVQGREQALLTWPWRIVVKVGQQALATFLTSMALAWILTIALDQLGREPLTVAAANIVGLATVVAVAYVVGWYKSEPWRRPRPQAALPEPVRREAGIPDATLSGARP
jgi:hypothetical protein